MRCITDSAPESIPFLTPVLPAAVLLASLWCSSSVRSSCVGYHLLRSGYFPDPGPLDRLLCSRSGPAPWRRGLGPRLTSGMARRSHPSIWLRTRVSAKPDTQHAEKLTPASGRSWRRFPVCRVNRSASVVVPLIPQRYPDTFKDPTYIHAILHDRAGRGDLCNLPENGPEADHDRENEGSKNRDRIPDQR